MFSSSGENSRGGGGKGAVSARLSGGACEIHRLRRLGANPLVSVLVAVIG